MVEFRYLIHKETGTVIKYEDWKEAAERDNFIIVKEAEVFVNPKNIVKAREMLFSDDFKIIYDSEFAKEVLKIEADKEEYILFPQTIDNVTYYSRSDLIERLRCEE